ncbi:GNAT family N-acetyltransferase [Brachybacterium sp. UNK5269]|uniref:GNAT family N-acetyltransferase n=1 Tax=Brachybacterium sp. UNK5269 TaxID=3408576 RepID=UPI003BB1527E
MSRRPRRPQRASALPPLTGSRLIEALIAGWRPLQRLDVGGFAVLRSRGITRRAHSIVALDPDPEQPAAALEQVESLLARAGERPVHRIFEHEPSASLDVLLAARGDEAVGHSEILELPLTTTAPPSGAALVATGALDADWFAQAWALAPREGEHARDTLRDILAGTPALQVRIPAADGTAAAVGRAALVSAGREQLAVLNMIAVAPQQRRQGLGRELSGTLLALAAAQGAGRALLEVERDNAPALSLYRALGSRRIGGYHYRARRED